MISVLAVPVPERITGAVDLLDRSLLGDWQEEIDPYQLNLESASDCTLGQLFGSYSRGLDALGIESDSRARELGFDLQDGEDDWEDLTAVWRGYLEDWAKSSRSN